MPTFPPINLTKLPNFPIPHLLLLVTLLHLCSISSSLQTIPQVTNSNILVGDAKNTSDNSAVQLTSPNSSSSTGLMIYGKPISLNPRISFSTDFTFSISPQNGHGLAFFIFQKYPFKFSRKDSFGVAKGVEFVGVEFNDNVGIVVNSFESVGACDLSKMGLVLKRGVKMHSWISYDSSSKRLEVRLSRFGLARPYNPLLAYQVDLVGMWGDERVTMGLSSSNGESVQRVVVYSWNVRTWSVPESLHSQPLDPRNFGNAHGEVKDGKKKKKNCVLGFLSGMIFVTGCGALAAFVVLSLWAIISSSNEAEIPVILDVRGGKFGYEKVNVVVEDSSADVKKHNTN